MRLALLAAVLLLAVAAPAAAQTQPQAKGPSSIILILDASKSMNDDDGSGQPKLEAAKEALTRVVDGLPDDAQVGLRLYGSELAGVSKQEGCQDTKLASPVGPLDRDALKGEIEGITARGRTPIGLALEKAGEDLPQDGRRTVILVSDGGSNCSPPGPCQAARDLAGGGVDLRIEAIGFQVADQARRQLECIAAAGGGAYRDAGDAGELADSLQSLSVRALRRFDASGTPISGGPDAARATAVPKPGQYLDSIAPNETRFYKIPVGLGQKLDTSGTIIARIPGRRGLFTRFDVEITNPDGDHVDNDSNNGVGGEAVSSVASTGQITEPEDSDLSSGDRAGEYLVAITLDDPDGTLKGDRYPVELLFRIAGTKANPAPTEAPDEEKPAPAAADDDTPGSLSGGIAAVILAIVAAGAALGVAALLRRRETA
jgi:Ca-activated chloride channel homolog